MHSTLRRRPWHREALALPGTGGSPAPFALVVNGGTGRVEAVAGIGLSQEELTDTIIRVAFYAGWSNAMSAITVAKRVFDGA
jgi:hypothetical protein